jgi:hypothetical protein
MAWRQPQPMDWPADRDMVRVVRHGPPDHADRCFHDLLWWSGRRIRKHRVAFAVPPTGPNIDDDGTWT